MVIRVKIKQDSTPTDCLLPHYKGLCGPVDCSRIKPNVSIFRGAAAKPGTACSFMGTHRESVLLVMLDTAKERTESMKKTWSIENILSIMSVNVKIAGGAFKGES